MEYKPYKIGDTLSSDREDGEKDDLEVIDFSQNSKVIFTSGLYTNTQLNFYTRRELDDLGYKLKTPDKWEPQLKEEYFYVSDGGVICSAFWMGLEISLFRLKNNNVFRKEVEAREAYRKIMNS